MSFRDLIDDALKGNGAEYCEIRIEETDSTRLTWRGKSLEDIAQTSGRGGNVRALVNGGWGFVCFNDLNGLKDRVADAVSQARAAGGDGSHFAEVDAHVDSVEPVLVKDPAEIPLGDKKRQMDSYNDVIWSVDGIQSSDMIYGDTSRKIHLGNSDGSYIEQNRVHVIARISAQARKNGDVQQAGFSIGSVGDYALVEGLDERVLDAANRAVGLLSAKPLEGGEWTTILDPVLAGVFVHEAFGHLSEADNVAENDKLQEIMVLGKQFAGKHLNVVDGASMPGLRGSYAYDEEGTPATRTDLIREGKLVGRLHSRETAARMGEITHRQRPRNLPRLSAHRPHDQHDHRERRGNVRGPAGGCRQGRLRQELVRRDDAARDVHLLVRRGLHDPQRARRRGGEAGDADRQHLHHPAQHRRHWQRPRHEPGRRMRQGRSDAPAGVQRQPAHKNPFVPHIRRVAAIETITTGKQGPARAGMPAQRRPITATVQGTSN